MPRGEASADSRPTGHRAVDRDESLTALCSQAVQRLAAGLPGAQVYCHLRVGDALRVVASQGGLRLIYEIRREQGGICWRAVETREPQLVEDVRRDPDYMTTDENVRSEVAVPVAAGDGTLLVLDAEFLDRTFSEEESRAVLAEAARLEAELAK
jgi:putative methionine-R-sulfoxide reductase with GAF domain